MRSLSQRGWVAIVIVVQLLLVGAAVAAPLSARLTGAEVRLHVAIATDTAAFRGDYVQLRYPDLPGQQGTFDPGPREQTGGTAYLPLTRAGEVWVGSAPMTMRPGEGPYLACDDQGWRVRCGIESWFLPDGEGGAMAQALRAGTVVAVVKVDARGHAALVGLTTR